MVHISENFADLLEPGLRKVFNDQYKQRPSMLPALFNMQKSSTSYEKTSSVGNLGDMEEFQGTVQYDDAYQGYDKKIEHTEYAKGIKIERKLYDDDLYNIINKKPAGLSLSAFRTRETHGASIFNEAFTTEYSDGDGAELCASDHGSNASASYSASNEGVAAASATNVAATRILMRKFTDDRGKKIMVQPDTILCPIELEDTFLEIVGSSKVVGSNNNNINVHYGKYKVIAWDYLTDANNWFMIDSSMMKMALDWFDRIPLEFMQDKDSDTLLAKYLAYMRYGYGYNDWRWIYGQKVS